MFLVYPARRNNVTCVFQRGRDEYIEFLRNGSEEKKKTKTKTNKQKQTTAPGVVLQCIWEGASRAVAVLHAKLTEIKLAASLRNTF